MDEDLGGTTTRQAGDPDEISQLQEDPPGRKLVVTIGIDQYKHWPTLGNAVNDAKGVDDLLVNKMDFLRPNVPPLFNESATKEAMTELVKEQLEPVLEKDDSLVLFFAGHGHTQVVEENGEQVKHGYLIPVDARNDHPQDYIPLHGFLRDISKLKVRHILVVLDACRSGMAFSGDVIQSTLGEESPTEPISNDCRMVISSARWDQVARDSGPIQDHSLFTGFLVQGLDWGTAASPEDTQVTALELGLFLQKRVGLESQQRQTPDFGKFILNARGNLIFSLDKNSYQAIKTRAFAALQGGMHQEFEELVQKLDEKLDEKKDSPWTLYLNYRKDLLNAQAKAAHAHIEKLRDMDLPRGVTPLSNSDAITLEVQLRLFIDLLSIRETADYPLKVDLEIGPDVPDMWKDGCDAYLSEVNIKKPYGDVKAYEIPLGHIARFSVKNTGDKRVHIYFVTVRPDGRLVPGPLLYNPDLVLDGLKGETEAKGAPFKVANIGLTETRLLCSRVPIPSLLRPPTTAARAQGAYQIPDQTNVSRKTIWYQVHTRLS